MCADTIKDHNENLLERSRAQWQFGDWKNLASLTKEDLAHHQDRIELALLAAAGQQQLGERNVATEFIHLALQWGCSKKLVSQVLIAGVHNTLGKASILSGQQQRALYHLKNGVRTTQPSGNERLLTLARAQSQFGELLGTKLIAGSEFDNSILDEYLSSQSHITNILALKRGSQARELSFSDKVKARNKKNRKHEGNHGLEYIKPQSNLREKVPSQDFVWEEFDNHESYPLKRVLFILSTPRSGSTALCNMIKEQTAIVAHEYFQPYQYMPELAKRWECFDNDRIVPEKYINGLVKNRAAPNGTLIINLHGGHLPVFSSFFEFLKDYPLQALIIERRNKISQAISYYIASNTEKWTSNFRAKSRTPKFSYQGIKEKLSRILYQEKLIENFILNHKIPFNYVEYEELLESKRLSLNIFSKYLGVKGIVFESRSMARQANEINKEFEKMFYGQIEK